MLTLQEATPEDWPDWRDVRLAALTDAPHAFRTTVDDWNRGAEQRWRERLAMPDALNLLARDDGVVVGLASGIRYPDGVAEVRSVWVSPRARGKGVADLLLTAIEEWAVRQGAPELRLDVLPGNERAIALYRRHGFVPTGGEEMRKPLVAKR
ncbi:ribosomal protein S18 acetylase RimI-like enzyme [Amycolatopsis bartoniae]|uniref:GNAT family N-acetyltransferase n=1 Tax=Amycolatopsis bartoniae TaxID=941986 RepID=UPI0018364CBD|nr:GNAT family N-acetyltransferase [Amycolatopsis bartoniae]MBB2934673.1 ribosomal protein S18 acetylase RimI-like enzyme [Amycolatopsis bartoniae]